MSKIRLKEFSTRAPEGFDKPQTKEKTAEMIAELDELQNLLYAGSKHAVLVVLQGMDASGKDGVIRNVLGQMNPQGVQVKSFKSPSDEEKAHDFLWRVHMHAPAKGMIQVFNRSHYEDILITRVHGWCDDETAKQRMSSINHFEKLLTENGTKILKFFLHMSPERQQERLAERLDDPRKMWKYNENDFAEAKLWDKYRDAYQDAMENCDSPEWIVVPCDQNWYKEYLVAKTLRDTLKDLNMKYPTLEKDVNRV